MTTEFRRRQNKQILGLLGILVAGYMFGRAAHAGLEAIGAKDRARYQMMDGRNDLETR